MTGIIIAKLAGTTLTDPNGIATAQTITAGASFVINGSLTTGGQWVNEGWGYKVEALSSGNDNGKKLIVYGKFWASDSVGAYSTDTTITLANAGTAYSGLYATEITGATMGTASAGTVQIGLDDTSVGVPVGLKHGSLYQANYGGTFGGATIQVKKYSALNNEWLPFGTETGEVSATVKNYELPAGTTLKAFLTTGSSTTAIGIDFEPINKQR